MPPCPAPAPLPRAVRLTAAGLGPALAATLDAIGLRDVVVTDPVAMAGGLISDADALSPALRQRGLRVWAEVRLDQLNPYGGTARAAGYRVADDRVVADAIVDPRAGLLAATADLSDPAVAAWWATRLRAWQSGGLAGVVLDHAGQHGVAFVTALRAAAPGVTIIAHLPTLRDAAGWPGPVMLDTGALDLDRAGTWTDLARLTGRLVLRGDAAMAPALGDGWVIEWSSDRPDDLRALAAAARVAPGLGAARPLPAPARGFTRRDGAALWRTDLAPGSPPVTTREADPPLLRQQSPPGGAGDAAVRPRVAIENVTPRVDDGSFPVKRVAGEPVAVACDLVCDGHDKLAGVLQWRPRSEEAWQEIRLQPLGNDRWTARFTPGAVGRYEFRLLGWRDAFATYQDELTKKVAAGLDVTLEIREGQAFAPEARDTAALLSPELAERMREADPRPLCAATEPFALVADRMQARFASWYELFPRSMAPEPGRHGTLRDVIAHLPRIAAMGFDVLYFPPVHPIGTKNRKGRNNSLAPAADDPGSPYAIGSAAGGHDVLHAELGTLEDFEALRAAAAAHGMELAIDFAIQCSPDHPWLREHPGWFDWRPDGSIRYAENPPKKYEDIVNVDFYRPDAIPDLWTALRDIVALWASRGVRVFRVDNPHTKPFAFWQWMIADVQATYPDTIFLAEAFTRPKVMARLGKVGFTQSYTYFTWRDTRAEIEQYLTELNASPWRECFRPNFFVNTPDINPPFLQTGGRAAHLIRLALATLLSGSWGMYSGFELCEATPLPGREEYLDSEKYQLRAWDWDRPGNITAQIARLNTVRRLHTSLQTHLGVTFLPCDDPQVVVFERANEDRSDVVICAVSLDPFGPHTPNIELALWKWQLPDQAAIACTDVIHDTVFTLAGKWQRVALTPEEPYTVWHARPGVSA